MVRLTDIAKGIKLPNKKWEEWKYAKNLDFISEEFSLESKGADFEVELPIDAYKIIFLNGVLISIDENLPKELIIKEISEKENYEEKYPFAQINSAIIEKRLSIRIKKNHTLKKMIGIISKSSSEENLIQNVNISIELEENSSAKIVEYFSSKTDSNSYFSNIVFESFLQKNSSLTHYKIQNESLLAWHISLTRSEIMENAKYDRILIQKGAKFARDETEVLLKEEGGQANIDAIYPIKYVTESNIIAYIKHLAPNTFSNQLVKAILKEKAYGSFQGKIHIARNAIKTIGNQSHHSILLSDEAEVNCKPELEIFADDVKCSHGATSGILDEEMLFYMQSRGINKSNAKKILTEAYLEEVINKIDDTALCSWTKTLISIQG